MFKLEQKNPEVSQWFITSYHVARRRDRYWAGLFTDLIIEQILMRNMKSVGGLTHGRA